MITEILLGVGAAGIGSLYIWLKRLRKKEFAAYLASEEKRLKLLKAEGWIVSAVDIPLKINYNASWKKFNSTKFWNYEFNTMVVLEKKNG